MEGTPFGRYRLIELLGRGGMGEVWRAHDTDTDRTVAIKVLPASLSEDGDFQRRFRREAHAAARLNSPHVIPIHNYGEIDGRLYLDMRLINGRDLASALADGPLEPTRAVHIVSQVAEALHAAHDEGLLHRDIKPSNILLDKNDFAYLIDFGIARTLGETRMTQTGNTIGTFQYIAPERLTMGADEDARADIYSLACVLYECLTGAPPFPGETMPQLVAAHLSAPPPQASMNQPNVPAPVDEVIARGMAKDPNQRYASTIELADAARDALTVPIRRPAAAPTVVPTTQHAGNRVPPQPRTVTADSPPPANPVRHKNRRPAGPPPQAPSPTPAMAGGISRRLLITLIVGGVVFVVLPVAGIGVSIWVGHSSQSVPTSSTSPTSSVRSYGPQIVLPFTGLDHPCGAAVDSDGTLYVVDYGNNRVVKLAAGSSAQEVLPFTGLYAPLDVAVDAARAAYVADNANSRVVKLAAGSSAQEVLPFTGLSHPDGVAVDAAGTVYVADAGTNRVLKLAAGTGSQTVLAFTELHVPHSVVVDAAGTVYVADMANNRVVKLAAGSSAPKVLPFTDLSHPTGVAVDAAGTVYVADADTNRVLKLEAGSGAAKVLPFTDLNHPFSVVVDRTGNLFVTDSSNNRVLKLPVQ
ncbi:hypothetical protein A5791_06840 [Mycobacterium sp. 852002-51163_SCH5372311]|uniref:serine/threonine-protein kinase PknD n=1 Tax=Mycobacterium sp. 852002-51163_SCH5372311 TaxID=1834097 RepID=UPI000801195A|nr:serine/threonine-protein kinase PknD [Mycobacterium sp. 852002-51163_SCH5372311]OBF81022.1 hypothetical protein A5791_06840 [Mycobacterium sp. 852002-51163_SCH5372311]